MECHVMVLNAAHLGFSWRFLEAILSMKLQDLPHGHNAKPVV